MISAIRTLRKEIQNIRRAQQCGTANFEALAVMHCSGVYKAKYRELKPISDTMAMLEDRVVITQENLQYFPAKVHYFFPKYS